MYSVISILLGVPCSPYFQVLYFIFHTSRSHIFFHTSRSHILFSILLGPIFYFPYFQECFEYFQSRVSSHYVRHDSIIFTLIFSFFLFRLRKLNYVHLNISLPNYTGRQNWGSFPFFLFIFFLSLKFVQIIISSNILSRFLY